MEVLRPTVDDPLVSAPVIQPGVQQAEAEAEVVASPRTRRMVSNLLQRVFSLERIMRRQNSQPDYEDCPSSPVAVEQNGKKCPYSAMEKNPSVPYVFQMPVHYPRYTKAEYESMPEWQLDRLLEEYGLPVSGSLEDKREYVIGAFLWRD